MDHSLALATDGTLFAFGDGSLGQLGRETDAQTANSRDPEDWVVRGEDGQPLLFNHVRFVDIQEQNMHLRLFDHRPCGCTFLDALH